MSAKKRAIGDTENEFQAALATYTKAGNKTIAMRRLWNAAYEIGQAAAPIIWVADTAKERDSERVEQARQTAFEEGRQAGEKAALTMDAFEVSFSAGKMEGIATGVELGRQAEVQRWKDNGHLEDGTCRAVDIVDSSPPPKSLPLVNAAAVLSMAPGLNWADDAESLPIHSAQQIHSTPYSDGRHAITERRHGHDDDVHHFALPQLQLDMHYPIQCDHDSTVHHDRRLQSTGASQCWGFWHGFGCWCTGLCSSTGLRVRERVGNEDVALWRGADAVTDLQLAFSLHCDIAGFLWRRPIEHLGVTTPTETKFPQKKPSLWFQELNNQYGPVVYLRIGRTPTIVLGTAQAAWDILEKQSSATSSRPRSIRARHFILLWPAICGMTHTGTRDFKQQQDGVEFFTKVSDTYKPIQSLESKQLIFELSRTPAKYREYLERYATYVVVVVTYGRRVHDIDKDEVAYLNRQPINFLLSVSSRGGNQDGDWSRSQLIEERQKNGMSLRLHIPPEPRSGLASKLLRGPFQHDSVVGPDRMPISEDLDDLPFIRTIVNEVLRRQPVAVLASTEDLVYQGMFIPKGSTIIANVWGINLNPADFPDPDRFDPERVARILWGFNLCKARDEEGNEVDVDTFAYTNDKGAVLKTTEADIRSIGFNSVPLPFSISITPRSPEHLAIIERKNETAQEEMKAYDS
ncbi:cytochrome P450 [Mycena sanguinolenta]|nr:cytochrome P450 [Mycena sanguinolenta]